jgi:ribosomal protein S18 acetylase RimI-like enzyme
MIDIRPATIDDAEWILPLSARLHDFGPPAWRPREEMDAAVAAAIEAALRTPEDGQVVLVARGENGEPLGFVHVHSAVDYFTHETHSHVSDLAITREAEGRGVGRALMDAAESLAIARGHRLLTLNVFDANHRARRLYDRLGYSPDTTKLVKVLRSAPSPAPGSSPDTD